MGTRTIKDEVSAFTLGLVCAFTGCGDPFHIQQWCGAYQPLPVEDPGRPPAWISDIPPCPKESSEACVATPTGSHSSTDSRHGKPRPPPLNPPATVAGYIVGRTPLFFYGKHLYYPGDVFQNDWIVDRISASGVTLHSRWDDDSAAAMKFKRDAWEPLAAR